MLGKAVLFFLCILPGILTYYSLADGDFFGNLLKIMVKETDESSTTFAHFNSKTPAVTTIGTDSSDGRSYVVPWPGNKYHIFLDGTNQVICSRDGRLHICDADKDNAQQYIWECVEKDGYFGFFNTQTGKFIGHGNDGRLRSTAKHHNDWELMTARRHPEGGYELLMPFWWHALKKICVRDGSEVLVLEGHRTTRWQFVETK